MQTNRKRIITPASRYFNNQVLQQFPVNEGACESDRHSQVWEWHCWGRKILYSTIENRDKNDGSRADLKSMYLIILLCGKYGSRSCHIRLWLIFAAKVNRFVTVTLKWYPTRLQKVLRSSSRAALSLFCLLVCSSVPRFTSTVPIRTTEIMNQTHSPKFGITLCCSCLTKTLFFELFERKCSATLYSKDE
jgi:hypothetical protein